MIELPTTPLTDRFGVRVDGVDLRDVTEDSLYPEIRSLFETHSALLFPRQALSEDDHLRFARLFGPIEDRQADERKPGEEFKVPRVTNETDDGVTGEMDLHTLNLKSNFLWHADSTFMPVPALANILIGRVVTENGGATELASTRAALAVMPNKLRRQIEGRHLVHRYSHSRSRISPELAKLPMFNKWDDQTWPAIWTNPTNGLPAIYIASHAFAVEGLDEEDGSALIDEVISFCTERRFVYSHQWRVGDVLIWDQRAILHRGTPWPFDQPRTLSSLCVSVSDADGLSAMRGAA